MIRFGRSAIYLAVLTCLVPAERASAADESATAAGKTLADMKCAACHAAGAEGASKLAKAKPLRDVASSTPKEKLSEVLATGLSKGHGHILKLTSGELQVLADYMNELRDHGGTQQQ